MMLRCITHKARASIFLTRGEIARPGVTTGIFRGVSGAELNNKKCSTNTQVIDSPEPQINKSLMRYSTDLCVFTVSTGQKFNSLLTRITLGDDNFRSNFDVMPVPMHQERSSHPERSLLLFVQQYGTSTATLDSNNSR